MQDISFIKEEFLKYSKLVFQNLSEEPEITLSVDPALSHKDAFHIEVSGGKGFISGSNKISLLIAVYRFFRELGCRFLRPGKNGEYIKQSPLSSAKVSLNETATSDCRCMIIEGAVSFENVYDMIDFCPKIGLNKYEFQFKNCGVFFDRWYGRRSHPFKKGESLPEEEIARQVASLKAEAVKRGIAVQTMGHGWTAFPFGFESDGWGEEQGEISDEIRSCLALKDGKRGLINGKSFLTQICYSNPLARKKICDYVIKYCGDYPETDILLFATADAINNCCECENCRDTRLADHLTVLFNELDERMTQEGLEQKILFAAYLETLWPPVKEKLNNTDRFIFGIYPISHVYHDPIPVDAIPDTEPLPYETNRLKRTYDTVKNLTFLKCWQKVYPENWVIGEYHFMWDHYLDPGYQKICRVLYEDIKDQDKLGLSGMEMYQPQRCTVPTAMGLQTYGAALWNKNVDFDELSRDYFTHAYGDGGEEVYAYLQTLSDTFDMKIKPGGRDYTALDCIPVLEKCIEIIKSFHASHEFSAEGRSELEAISWRDLELHGEYLQKYYSAFLLGLKGYEAEGEKLIEELILWMYGFEDEVQERWDIWLHARMIPIWYSRLMEQKKKEAENKKASDLLGGAGDQGIEG